MLEYSTLLSKPKATIELTNAWLQDVQSHASENELDDPNYFSSNPETLIATSIPSRFNIGTGEHVLSQAFSRCLSTEHVLIIVTCFWAKSTSREAVASLLLKLSEKAISEKRKIQVRICFSSSSILQKLSQTSSLNGKFYPPSSWKSLGLPSPEQLEGLEMTIKSVFVLPFSVMHPKFIIMDRKLAFIPSCNVSWEEWFEGCVELEGGITEKLFQFWKSFWMRGSPPLPEIPKDTEESTVSNGSDSKDKEIQTILLPSPHHINPRFQPLTKCAPPPTPLNLFILQLFAHAERDIYIQTPNLTSQPLINALFAAIERGINIHLVTSSRLMILEQLATAGTITEYEVWKLIRRYRALLQSSTKYDDGNLENGLDSKAPGVLQIGYFEAKEGREKKSHLKCVIMDECVTVLGSGNMDRASWFTSQELGIALFSKEFAGNVRGTVHEGLEGRIRYVC